MTAGKTEKIVPKRPQRVVGMNEGSRKARKSAARLAAVQVLYQMAVNEQDAKSALRDFVNHRVGFELDGDVFVPADQEMLTAIVTGFSARREDVNQIVQGALAAGRGQATSVELLLRCILQCGVCELLEHADIDAGIIISDYLNVTHAFYEGGEPALVNGVLDAVAKKLRP